MTSAEFENKAKEYRNDYVVVYDSNSISYQQFVQYHLLKNEPCIIKNIVYNNNDNWYIYKKWLNHNDDNGDNESVINYKYLINNYGNTKVDVAYCGNKSYSDQQRISMELKDFLKYLQDKNEKTEKKDNDENIENLNHWLNNIKQCKLSKFDPKWTSNILYCKDWHIVRDLKQNYYETPTIFSDDWLNYYWQQKGTNDYKFCYFGPQFSWTPLHHDVYSSYSWSANVIGKKLWILFSPKESKYYLKNKKRNEWIYSLLSLVDNETIDDFKKSEYPNLNELFEEDNKMLSTKMIIQNENEAIFIPSMWFHEVYNLTDIVLSINHNWFNGFSIHWIWKCIYSEYQNVCQSIDDLRDILDENAFYDKCQELLMDFLGINFDEFMVIISINTQYILKILIDNDIEKNIENFKIKCYLFSMKNVLNMIQHVIKTKCMNKHHMKQLNDIKINIEETLSQIKFLQINDELWKVSDTDL